MTFSIIALDQKTGCLGVAVSTANLAVGAVGYQALAGVGIIATQYDPHPILGFRGLCLLAESIDVEDVLELLLKSDEGRSRRQIHRSEGCRARESRPCRRGSRYRIA